MRFHRAIALSLLVLSAACLAHADEGMWTFDNFPVKTLQQKYAFAPNEAWLNHLRLSAVRLAGGCSASFVSGDGLVMTNAHCAIGCVRQLSTAQKDLSVEGYVAKSGAEELQCPNVEVNQLVQITDVTPRVNGATRNLDDKEYNKTLKAEMGRIEKECAGDAERTRCDVVPLYHGGLYHLYKYRTYRDVRLVFTPEADVAFFGGDPDNFNFPRYNLDVAFLRAYEDGKPASTPDHLTWSGAGPREGELVFMAGNPGGTDRLLTVAQLEFQRDVEFPRRLVRTAERRGVLTQFAKEGAEQKRISENPILFVENSFKASWGEYQTVLDKQFMAAKVKAEQALRARVASDPRKQAAYGSAWDEIAKALDKERGIYIRHSMLEESGGFTSDLFRIARTLVRGAAERPKPSDQRLREFRDSAMPSLERRLFSKAPIYPELEQVTLSWSLTKLREDLGTTDPIVEKVLGKESPENVAKSLVEGSKLADISVRKRLWEGGQKEIDASDDPMIRLAVLVDPESRAMRAVDEDEVEAVVKKNSELIAKAMFEDQGTSVYPDATFTPRVTFGTVKGWEEHGNKIGAFTTIDGLYDRATGQEPYALPSSWLDARGRVKQDTPMNFSSDCDIIGGNSGSPVVNKAGEIVGIVFDGNIHSLGGNYWFDERLNRAVSVDSRTIVEALKSVYGADRLLKELKP